jgi:hypothetical protein
MPHFCQAAAFSRWTNMMKLMVAFCNFSKASKNYICNSFNTKYYFNDTFKHRMDNEWTMRFPVLMVLTINNTVFRAVTPCSLVQIYWTFYETSVNFYPNTRLILHTLEESVVRSVRVYMKHKKLFNKHCGHNEIYLGIKGNNS